MGLFAKQSRAHYINKYRIVVLRQWSSMRTENNMKKCLRYSEIFLNFSQDMTEICLDWPEI